MNQFEKLTSDDKAAIVAALGRVISPSSFKLYERLHNDLTIKEQFRASDLRYEMEFSERRNVQSN